jgi:hypothetical protein
MHSWLAWLLLPIQLLRLVLLLLLLTVCLPAPDECAHGWRGHDGVLAHVDLLEAVACCKLHNDLRCLLAKVPENSSETLTMVICKLCLCSQCERMLKWLAARAQRMMYGWCARVNMVDVELTSIAGQG